MRIRIANAAIALAGIAAIVATTNTPAAAKYRFERKTKHDFVYKPSHRPPPPIRVPSQGSSRR